MNPTRSAFLIALLVGSFATTPARGEPTGSATAGDTTFRLQLTAPAASSGDGRHVLQTPADRLGFALSAVRPGAGPPLRPFVRVEHFTSDGAATVLWGGSVAVEPNAGHASFVVEPEGGIPGGEVAVQLRYRRLDETLVRLTVPARPSGPPAPEAEENPAGPATMVSALDRPSGTNVALARYRTKVEGSGGSRLIDGDSDTGPPFTAPHGRPAVLRFLKPYRLVAASIHLSADDDIGYRLRVETSLDGEDWSLLSDLSERDHAGRIELAVPGIEVQFFRVVGLSSTRGEQLRLDEVEVFTDEHVPLLNRNLAAAAHGGSVLSAPVDQSVIPPARPARLVDGETGRRGWASPVPDGPAVIDLLLGGGKPAMVEAVVAHTSPREEASGPARLEVSASAEEQGETFESVGVFTFPSADRPRLAVFQPTPARRIRLRLLDPAGGDRYRLSEIEVHEVAAEGSEGVLDGSYLLSSDGLEPPAERNIADPLLGGSATMDGSDPKQLGDLLDPSVRRGTTLKKTRATLDFATYRNRPAHLSAVWLRIAEAPEGARLRIATAALPDGALEQVADVPLPPVRRSLFPPGWYVLTFDSLEASRLHATIDAGDGLVKLDGLAVLEARGEGYVPITERGRIELTSLGANAALAALGGTIRTPDPNADPSELDDLIDGLVGDLGGSFGATKGLVRARTPLTVILDLAGDEALPLVAIGIDGTTVVPLTERDDDFRRARRSLLRRADLMATLDDPASPDAEWTALDEITLLGAFQEQRVALPPGTKARGLRLEMAETFGPGILRIGEIAVYVTPDATGLVVAERAIDVLQPALGGMLVTASSEDRYGPAASILGGAVEGSTSLGKTSLWRAATGDLPQNLTFAFAGWRTVALSRVVIQPGEGAHAARRPERVAIEVSTGAAPVTGFRRVGVFDWPREGALTARFEQPIVARFLRLVVLEKRDPDAPVALGPVSAIDARPAETLRQQPAAYDTMTITDEPPPAGDGDRPEEIVLGTPVEATLARPGDTHEYRLDVAGDLPRPILLSLQGRPRRGAVATIRPETGGEPLRFEPVEGSPAEFSVMLDPGRYTVSVTRPQPQVALLIDDSGSMQGNVARLRDTLRRYLIGKPEAESVSLIRFAQSVSVLSPSGKDASRHLAALDGALVADGSTSLYDGLTAALDEIAWRGGDRAVVLITDGADTASTDADATALWRLLDEAGVRLYAVALGRDMSAFNPDVGMAPQRLLEAWSLVTGGAVRVAPGGDDLDRLFTQIASNLRGPLGYRLLLSAPDGEGLISVSGDEAASNTFTAAPVIGFVYDSSGSMAARDSAGERRVEGARRAFANVLDGLPDNLEAALVAYGHRLPREPKPASCDDVELLAPLETLKREALRDTVDGLRPGGQTPIGRALIRLTDHLLERSGARKTIVVVITDGEETCDTAGTDAANPISVVERLRDQGVDVTVNVVGFAIDNPGIVAQLAEIARAGGGGFFPSADAAGLAEAVRSALSASYTVRDAAGRTVARGSFGQPAVEVPPGRYQVHVAGVWPLAVEDVEVRNGQHVTLAIRREGDRFTVDRRYRESGTNRASHR